MKKWSLQSGGDQIISSINITPLTDVMLVLLVIFMVTTPLIMMESFKIKLPKAVSSGAERGEGITVMVTSGGDISIDGAPIDRDRLYDFISGRVADTPEVAVIIKADTDALHGSVVEVLDTAKRAGAKRLSIATVPGGGQ
ncbi:MAG: ExbD/TolR family protein [Thermodesulfobacteriota bacterium]